MHNNSNFVVSKARLYCACSVESSTNILLIFMQARNKQLAKTMEEFDLTGETKEHEGEDLLDLLDAACSMK